MSELVESSKSPEKQSGDETILVEDGGSRETRWGKEKREKKSPDPERKAGVKSIQSNLTGTKWVHSDQSDINWRYIRIPYKTVRTLRFL